LAEVGGRALSYSTQVVELVAYAVTTCFLALYLVIDRNRMRGALFSLVPRTFHVRMSRILLKLETIVGGYVRGQIITSILMAIFTFIVLLIARAPNASALAAFAGVADVLPYIGGILATGPAVIAAASHSPTTAIVVAIALLCYQEFESRVIVPRVYGDALRLPPSVVLLSLLIGGTLMGILGALLALPIAAGIRMLVDELQFDLPGEDPMAASNEESRLSADERSFARRAAGASPEKAAVIATEIAAKELLAEEASLTTPPLTAK
ncbi:MAG: AI-2E family transporter, partial [Polyangiaceae bacterium]